MSRTSPPKESKHLGITVEVDSEAEGNLSYREREGYRHNGAASDEYTYNGLRFFWNPRVR